jgi:hypothetical protein
MTCAGGPLVERPLALRGPGLSVPSSGTVEAGVGRGEARERACAVEDPRGLTAS